MTFIPGARRVALPVAIVTLALAIGSPPAYTEALPQKAAQPPRTRTQKPTTRRVQPRPTMTLIVVRDRSGAPVVGARVIVSGAMSREAVTDANGIVTFASMRDGSYRLRFEKTEFITLEREVTLKNGQPAQVEVALSAASPPPPAPPPGPTAAPGAAVNGLATHVSIPAFLDKNFIGRDPLKESVLGCTAGATTRLLQLREPLAGHAHTDLDEMLYIVAGEGAVIRDEAIAVSAGSLIVIPRGVPHAIERRGRNPLIVLSTLAGAPCRLAPALQPSAR